MRNNLLTLLLGVGIRVVNNARRALLLVIGATSVTSCGLWYSLTWDECAHMRLHACDHPDFTDRPKPFCRPGADHEFMTVALYDHPNGNIIARLKDTGEGIPYEQLSVREGWWEVRICETRQHGFLSTDEPFGATASVQ